MAKIDPANEALLNAAAQQCGTLVMGVLESISEAQSGINRFRHLAEGMNAFAVGITPAGLDKPGIVADVDKLLECEARLWDAMELMLGALEPDDEMLSELTGGDDEAISMFQNIVLENRAKLAEKRAAALGHSPRDDS